MVITAIEPRRKGFSQLYIDGEQAVRLDTEMLLQNKIRIGTEITDDELLELIQKSEARRASEKALYLLEHRNHSKKELADKISRVTSREAASAAAQHMEDIGLVNDEDFARLYARELFCRKKYGTQRVKQELYRKGIDRELIDIIIQEYGDYEFKDNIREILARKYPGYCEDEKIRRRAFAGLQRMGYKYDEIKDALNFDDEY